MAGLEKRVEELERSAPRFVPRVGGGGIAKATLDALAADVASTQGASSLDSLFLDAEGLSLVASATATSVAAFIGAWNLADAATQSVGAARPSAFWRGWSTINVQALWAPSTAVAGNVRFEVNAGAFALGAAPAAGNQLLATIASPAVIDQVVLSDLGNVALPAGAYRWLRLSRLGADVADTTTADAKLIGLQVTKVS